MTTPHNLTDLSESELAHELERYEVYVFDLETELHEARKIVGELKAEQDRRRIAQLNDLELMDQTDDK